MNSKLDVEQAAYFQDEVFGNQGPLPLQVGIPTTYTILWQAKNFSNDVENVKVRATLPQGVQLTGNIFPKESILTFDQISREVVWDVGDLLAGTGPLEPASSVAFQVRLVPIVSQKGSAVKIIGEARIQADDVFTERTLFATDSSIDTTLPDDDSVTDAMGVVQ